MIVETAVHAPRPPRLRGLSVLLAGLLLGGIAPVVARAAPNYYVYLDGLHQGNGSTPIRLTLEYPVGSSIRSAIGHALPGRIAGMAHVESNFLSGFSDGGSAYSQVQEGSDDFVITGGPGPSVTGTFHFRVDLSLMHEGGFEANGGNGASVSASVSAHNLSANGGAHSNNNNSGATGLLSAIGPSGGAIDFDLTGSFPVGTPFNVFIGLVMEAYTYGNVYCSPARAGVSAGLAGPGPGIAIGNGSGTVMDLPPGYTVNSPAWGVADNQLVPVADVPAPPAAAFRFERVTPNPSATTCRLAFTLPHEADASLTLFDVQGREVRSLAAGKFAAGRHEFVWDGLGASGQPAAAGIYLAVARAGEARLVQRIARTR